MKVLLAGGSGIVGTLVIPFLKKNHTLRVFDRHAPADSSIEFLQGDITDPQALDTAAKGMDAFIYLAMGNLEWEEWSGIDSAYDVNIKGLHFLLERQRSKGSHKRFIAVVCLYILILEVVIFLTKKSLQMKRNYTDLQNGWENRYVEMLGVAGVVM